MMPVTADNTMQDRTIETSILAKGFVAPHWLVLADVVRSNRDQNRNIGMSTVTKTGTHLHNGSS